MENVFLELASFEAIRRNWPYLTPEKKQELIDANIVQLISDVQIKMHIRGDHYTAELETSRLAVFVADGREIANTSGVLRLDQSTERFNPQTIYSMAMLGLSQEPRVAALLAQSNGGVMPAILQPAQPETPDEPETDEGI